ncbi:MAG: glycoside hydrolase family 43 protein [Mediterranea sp.]|nr:glycoside hydrolase family 43 protein [Mediterranea sp.]
MKEIRSGEIWPDTEGNHINAHGGGVMYHEGTYYWYGEHKSDTTCNAMVGVMCYSSTNLTDWKNEGVVLSVADDDSSDIARGCILERPKVVYNSRNDKFVMWFHLELKGQGYAAARAGVAVGDSPVGPFHFLRSERVNAGCLPFDMSQEEVACFDTLDGSHFKEWWTRPWEQAVQEGLFLKRDLEGGQMARDMTLFVDDDGKAYHIYASEENLTLHIAELSNDYRWHTGRFVRVAAGGMNEAPALFKHDGTYWMITSGCTGWAPNEARLFSAKRIWGPWIQHPTPCVGPDAEITFKGQSTYILPVAGRRDAYIFMADSWRPEHPSDGRYIWLPIRFSPDGTPVIEWKPAWNLNYFDKLSVERQ